ncbi:hypothetical protein ACHAW6_004247 [Cyclotella cf. meneghiniana]
MQMSTSTTLGLSPTLGMTTSNYLAIYYIASVKTALPLTHLNVNGLSKKLTGWVIGLVHGVLTLEEENRHYPPHGCPCNASKLCMFICFVNYFQDMWPSPAIILKPLTDHSGLKKLFSKMHALSVKDSLPVYPEHNKWLEVYTDESDNQLGLCNVQVDKPVDNFYHKLSKSQQNYTIMEKEMLSIVATLNEF